MPRKKTIEELAQAAAKAQARAEALRVKMESQKETERKRKRKNAIGLFAEYIDRAGVDLDSVTEMLRRKIEALKSA